MGYISKKITTSLVLVGVATLGMAGLPANASAQESRQQKQQQSAQENRYRDQTESSRQNQQQQDVQAYRGQISSKHGKVYFEEVHSHNSYLLADTWEAKRFLNKKVRVTGWLDADLGILHVISMSTTP
jgi:Tfp pilus assembly protein PilV